QMGAGGKLEVAAPQLLGMDKLNTGGALIQKYCVPNEWNNYSAPTADLIIHSPLGLMQWKDFAEYCEIDAKACASFGVKYGHYEEVTREQDYELLTAEMNQNGWFVDMPLVYEMQRRYEMNVEILKHRFYQKFSIDNDKFLHSSVQMKNWCKAR